MLYEKLHNQTDKNKLRSIQLYITVVAILVGLFVPKEFVQSHINFVFLGLILLGIPHGASDFLIFKFLSKRDTTLPSPVLFLSAYLFVAIVYAIVWYFLPVLAFLIFILFSVHHFGESNWNKLKTDSFYKKSIIYLFWGGCILGVPIFLNWIEAQAIIYSITDVNLALSDAEIGFAVCLLIVIALLSIIQVFEWQWISKKQFHKEIKKLMLLILLFMTTPLLIGFGVYFVFWHSLDSFEDQITCLVKEENNITLSSFFKQITGVTLLLITGVLVLLLTMDIGENLEQIIPFLFIILAVITIPHSIIMSQMYKE